MVKNYFKAAFRNIWQHKTFSFLNVMGLAIGMTACFLIYLYVRFETSYDSFHAKADRVYRLTCDIKTPAKTRPAFVTSWAMGPAMKAEFPEVEEVVRYSQGAVLVESGKTKTTEDQYGQADSTLFSVFSFPLMKGDPRTVLKEPGSMVISETAAKKYFGSSNPVGQQLSIESGRWTATITGIMKDMPENTLLKRNMFLSATAAARDLHRDESWGGFGNLTYILLKPGADARLLETKLSAFIERHMGSIMKERNEHYILSLEPLKDVYLHSKHGAYESGNASNVYIFSMIAIFILLIACFNFINLTTARASERAKEVGIRKVAGASGAQLIKQFMMESILICSIAFILAIGMSAILLPLFNQLSGKIISHNIFQHISDAVILFLFAAGIGIVAGIYPAFILSAYKPATVLKGRFAAGAKGIWLRKGLVITQFSISIILIIATIVVYTQLHYMRSQDLGFDIDQTVLIDTHYDGGQKALKQDLLNIPDVQSATLSWGLIGEYAYTMKIEAESGNMQTTEIDLRNVDYDFIPQYNIKMAAGRAFSKDYGTDSAHAAILNETAVKMLGYPSPDQIIGKQFISAFGDTGKIIGVVKDFHFVSLQQNIKPLCMALTGNFDLLSIKVSTRNLPSTLAAIEKKYTKFIPAWPFSYYFADEFFDRQYRAENRFGNLFLNFALLAILISCLGLAGLASYSTLQRTKEIGIRKVLGASASGIVTLLSKDFIKLVVIAFVIASPVAWFAMNRWVQDFAYRISISWWIFLVAGAAAILIALITVSALAIKAAIANPIKTLRTE